MRVYFDDQLYDFHNEYYNPIKQELLRRGHEVTNDNPDFVIGADEAYTASQFDRAKMIFIGHSFDAKGACTNHKGNLHRLEKNADYLFVYSKFYKDWFGEKISTPSFVTGMAKLDNLYHYVGRDKRKQNVLYAPTFNDELSSRKVVNLKKLKKVARVRENYHPAKERSGVTIGELLREADVVISDYSSVGMEAIVLNIPTILVDNPRAEEYPSFPPDYYVTNQARNAAICVDTFEDVLEALATYKDDPGYLERKRIYYGDMLCSYKNKSAIRTVNVLEQLYKEHHA